jgi:flagellar biosynthesis protein FlhF
MRIKSFLASTVQEALEDIKREMGNDSIILETRNIEEGDIKSVVGQNLVEVVAAVYVKNNDEGDNKNKDKDSGQDRDGCQDKNRDINQNDGQDTVQGDNGSLKLPEEGMGLYDKLCAQQVERVHSQIVIHEVLRKLSKDDYGKAGLHYQMIAESIMNNINIHDSNSNNYEKCKIMAFIGTTGIGKTTTISKLVSETRKCSDKDIVLISIQDNSDKRLNKIANLTGATVWTAATQQELREIIDEFGSVSHVFIDTPGINPLDNTEFLTLKRFLNEIPNLEIHLIVSAAMRYIDSVNIVKKCTIFPVHKLLFTKIDETDLYGTLFSVAMETQIPLSFITDGQEIPKDIRLATKEMVAEMVMRSC